MHEKQNKLRYLPLFYQDLQDTVYYLAHQLHNPAVAETLLNAVAEAIIGRSFCAESFEPFVSARDREHPYYRIYVKNYTVYYVVLDNVMEVRRLLYNKQKASAKI